MNLANGMYPTKRSVVSGARVTSHEQLAAQAACAAGGFHRLGVAPGDCVAIMMRNDPAFLIASYATMTVGAYAVPVNWHFKDHELGYILADCRARVLVIHADLLAAVVGAIPPYVIVLAVPPPPEVITAFGLDLARAAIPAGTISFEAWLAAQCPYDGPPLTPRQSMIYTSGTTGHPKGVRRGAPTPAQIALQDRLGLLVYGLEPGVRTLVPGPLYHSAPNSFGLRAGRVADVLVLMPRFEPEELLRLIERERIDTTFVVPTMFIRLLKLPKATREKYDVSSLRFVVHAAAPCPAEVKRAMIDWWGPVIREFYGSTEAGPLTLASSEDALRKPGTVGRPTPGAELRIVGEDGRVLPHGEVGEIYSRLEGYMDFAYHNDRDKRREIDRDGFITCGDVGYVDADGYLFLCDRKHDMVISGGVNIYPAEIEAVIHALPGVHDCAVFGVPDAEFGEALLALVEPAPGAALDPAILRTALTKTLASYKVPKTIEIRHGLPREDSGKILKRKLREPYWQDAGRRI